MTFQRGDFIRFTLKNNSILGQIHNIFISPSLFPEKATCFVVVYGASSAEERLEPHNRCNTQDKGRPVGTIEEREGGAMMGRRKGRR